MLDKNTEANLKITERDQECTCCITHDIRVYYIYIHNRLDTNTIKSRKQINEIMLII